MGQYSPPSATVGTVGPSREADRFFEVNELDASEVVEAVDARADRGAAGRVAYRGREPRV